MNELGKRIKQARIMLGLTLRDLAAQSGVSGSHLGRIERGERFPSAPVLRKIAKPLHFDEGALFAHAGYLSPVAPTTENEAAGRLDPYVARVLAQEPIEVQYAIIGILSILKSMARH